MNISQGFQIEQPKALVPWQINEKFLIDLFREGNLRKVTNGHYSLSCVSLGGLHHELGFHFYPRANGVLMEMEFYLKSPRSLTQSFKLLQKHFEAAFGVPAIAKCVRQTFPEYSYTWELKGVRIEHQVTERISEADKVRVTKV
jgi:hypothetical protein